ncbi:MAG: hypothetical protein ACYCZX_00815 [Rhodospirillaceae bacterium]
MQANTISRVLKGVYVATLIAATGVGAWAAFPYVKQQRAARAAPLTVHVYSHPFIPIFSDTPFGARAGASSVDNFFAQEVFREAVAALAERRPLPKAVDAEAWQQEAASSLTASANNYMGRRYGDALQRMGVANDARGIVLVRIENVGAAPVDEIRLEVTGGQLFMEGPAGTPKLRSLGTRAMRVGALPPGGKTELFALTTQDMSPGGAGPAVKVSSRDQVFPVVVHAQDAPSRPTLQDAGWIAFATFYLALILSGLGFMALKLMGVRFAVVTAGGKISAPVAAAPPVSPVPAPVQMTAAEAKAWQRPNSR